MRSISTLCYLIVMHTVLDMGLGQTSLSAEKGTSAINVERSLPTPTVFSELISNASLGGNPTQSSSPSVQLSPDIFDSLFKQYMTSEDVDVSSALDQCESRRYLESLYFNFTTETGDRYCPSFYDEIQCWKASLPGNVTMQCPEFFNGITYDTNGTVSRVCLKNGTWGNDNRSDYSRCKAVLDLQDGEEESHPFHLTIIGTVGYSISLCTTLGALIILITCKSLWCLRNYIHMNFLISFIIFDLFYFGYLVAVHKGPVGEDNWYICPINTIVMAAVAANFCWMLVEGIYLYCTIVRGMTVPLKTLWLYALIGWVLPVILAIAEITVRLTSLRGFGTYNEECIHDHKAEYVIRIPLIIIVLINVYFLIHIIVVIVRGWRSPTSGDVQQYRKALRALVVLTPLLGAAYLLFLIEPTPDEPTVATHIYRYMLAFLQSTQGFFVALFYVFLNPEVHKLLKQRFMSLREDNTLFTNASSRKESKPSLPNIFHFAKTPKDVDDTNVKMPIEGDNNNQPNGEVPKSSSLGSSERGEEPGEATPLRKEGPDNYDVNANNFHCDQHSPDTDIESAPFVRHAGNNEEKRLALEDSEGEKSQLSVKT